jgi:hypothetical protein
VLERLKAVHAGHSDVHEDDVRAALVDQPKRIFGVARQPKLVALEAQEVFESGSDRAVVVDD